MGTELIQIRYKYFYKQNVHSRVRNSEIKTHILQETQKKLSLLDLMSEIINQILNFFLYWVLSFF